MNELKVRETETELTPIEIALQIDEEGRTTSRKLYEFLELDKSHYSRWVKKNITDNEFAEENNDYFALAIDGERDYNPNPTQDYMISAEFAKKLAMGSHTAKGEQARNYFIKVEDKLKEVAKTMQIILSEEDKYALSILHANTKEEILMLIKQHEDEVVKPLRDSLDRYERFLCEKTGMLTKTELSTKLDTKPQTLAAKLKKAGVYTKTSQISGDFLKKYPDTKIIVECNNTYIDDKGIEHTKPDFQWTHEGSKILVDYLISIGMVTFTDNNGFKLNVA